MCAAQGMGSADANSQFKLSPDEQRMIGLDVPASILMLGRSGTMKTTVTVFTMILRWMSSRPSSQKFHQVGALRFPTLTRTVG